MAYKTPMLQQYEQIKAHYPDCLLFFRLGDFYELFGEDAKLGSEVLHITLTARDKGADGKIPMCGVPFHASENYIARLVHAGYKVAICEQVSEAGKGLVKREVVRVVTAGTLLRDETLTEPDSKYIISLVLEEKQVGGAAADLSTGEFFAFEFKSPPATMVPLLMSHFRPREVIVPRQTYDTPEQLTLIRSDSTPAVTCVHDWLIYTKDAAQLLHEHFRVTSLHTFNLQDKPLALKGAAALLGYLRYTQKGEVAHITSIREFHLTGHLVLDHTTLRHLEVLRTSEGMIEGSLFGTLNRTATASGQRLLCDWLVHPITNREELEARHCAVEELMDRSERLTELHAALGQLSDSERLVGRLSVGLGSPRDLRRLVDSLHHSENHVFPLLDGMLAERLRSLCSPLPPELATWVVEARAFLKEEAPPTLDEGHIFTEGYDSELDVLRSLTSGNQAWLTAFEAKERERTGIAKLRVVYSRAFGYAVEVSKGAKEKVPADYIPRQTLVNAERYTCQALVDYERKALSALDQMIALEKRLFAQQTQEVVRLSAMIAAVARQVAQLDVLVSFALVARSSHYVRPTLTETSGIVIKEGRHPVIEQLRSEPFVTNDTQLLPDQSLQLITGPNMAGKSTYIRQVALITLLAHTGSFVPAREATLGMVDRIFTRIGAHDNLRAGQSTFMVEMLETAHILHNATQRSLVILDEVGRGTSPEDGFALAWAIAETLATKSHGLVLFATHFHALKELAQTQPKVFNSHLAVAADKDDLIFLRKVVGGPTDESFGIVVAEKAGIPRSVIQRAKQLALSSQSLGKGTVNPAQLSLMAAPAISEPTSSEIEIRLRTLNLNELTPIQALMVLNELQKEVEKA